MPRCDCSGGQCGCVVIGGSGATVTGAGSVANPYIIDADPQLNARLRVADTSTVDLQAVGNGTPDDPLVVSATATVALDDLTDVDAPTPSNGDTVQWNGSAWVAAPPAVVPPGAVNVGPGLTGSGSVDSPVAAAVSGVWGSGDLADYGDDSTVGLAIYVDANGQLRAEPRDTSGVVEWDDIDGKPSSFPTTWDDVAGKPTSWPVTDSTNFITGTNGWAVEWEQAHRTGQVVTLSFRVRRTGAAIDVPASGNLANNTCGQIGDPSMRPYQYGPLATTSTGPLVVGTATSTGAVVLTATVPNVDIARGAVFVFTGTWVCVGS